MTIRHPGDLAEFTGRAVVAGVLLVVFGAANAYLGLRVGITVSASIPWAIAFTSTLMLCVGPSASAPAPT